MMQNGTGWLSFSLKKDCEGGRDQAFKMLRHCREIVLFASLFRIQLKLARTEKYKNKINILFRGYTWISPPWIFVRPKG